MKIKTKQAQASTLVLAASTFVLIFFIVIFFLFSSMLVNTYKKSSINVAVANAEQLAALSYCYKWLNRQINVQDGMAVNTTVYQLLMLDQLSEQQKQALSNAAFDVFGDQCFVIVVNGKKIASNCLLRATVNVPNPYALDIKVGLKKKT